MPEADNKSRDWQAKGYFLKICRKLLSTYGIVDHNFEVLALDTVGVVWSSTALYTLGMTLLTLLNTRVGVRGTEFNTVTVRLTPESVVAALWAV